MADPQEVLAERVSAAVTAAFGAGQAGADPLIRPSQFADFQANVALPLAKSLGMPPRQAAERIVAHLDVADVCDAFEISGPGFVNLTLASDWIARQASGLLSDE
ncbi:MAG TPA: arginine--tRNA ligase, partial [Streptosporangiaceae bacterium]|nr:arginine--tRNA ligase [Streptosporangiaceae bacterium]